MGLLRPPAQSRAGSVVRSSRSELYPLRTWKPPRMVSGGETAQPLWATCSTAWLASWGKKLLLISCPNHWHFNSCPSNLVFLHCSVVKGLAPFSWRPPYRLLLASLVSSKALSFPGWVRPAPSDFPRRATAPASNHHGGCLLNSRLLLTVYIVKPKLDAVFYTWSNSTH